MDSNYYRYCYLYFTSLYKTMSLNYTAVGWNVQKKQYV